MKKKSKQKVEKESIASLINTYNTEPEVKEETQMCTYQ